MKKSKLSYKNLQIRPVEDFTVFDGFCCLPANDTDRDLEEFIREDAARHALDSIAITYALERVGHEGYPLGFATLQNDAIEPATPVGGYVYKALPAVKIGRIGVALAMQRQGIGTIFLHMLLTMLCNIKYTGCRFITVDARRDKKNKVNVQQFYGSFGFEELPSRPKTSAYIPMYFDILRTQPLPGAYWECVI